METWTKCCVLLMTLSVLIDKVNCSVKCYECTVQPRRINLTERLCYKFDESDFFKVDCPFSTMCKKRTYRIELLNGQIQESYERGCASQKNDSMDYQNNKWVKVVNVVEAYQEGCIKESDGSEYCHCRGNFCNTSSKIDSKNSLHTDTMAVIFVFNLVKYFRNMDY